MFAYLEVKYSYTTSSVSWCNSMNDSYEYTKILCENVALHNCHIYSSNASHQDKSPEVQGLQNSYAYKEAHNKTLET